MDRPTIRMIGDRKMQCKDIPDEEFLLAVKFTPTPDGRYDLHLWRMRWDVQATLEAVRGPIPTKLFLAKASKLIVADKLHGCDCGCRGDYHFPRSDGPCC
jgi:hypothetical protein